MELANKACHHTVQMKNSVENNIYNVLSFL